MSITGFRVPGFGFWVLGGTVGFHVLSGGGERFLRVSISGFGFRDGYGRVPCASVPCACGRSMCVSASGLWVRVWPHRVSDSGSLGFRFRVWGPGLTSGFGFQVSSFGSGFGFRVSGPRCQVSGFWFRISGFSFWGWVRGAALTDTCSRSIDDSLHRSAISCGLRLRVCGFGFKVEG